MKKDEGKTIRIVLLIVCYINLALSIANVFINSVFLRGLIWGVNITTITVAITSLKVFSYNMRIEFKELRELQTKLGFRKDFDPLNRWQLVTYVKGNRVSTVDLGLDHSFGIGEPLYYETMIFGDDRFEDYQVRYSTKKEAKKGHKKAIKYVKEKLKEETIDE